MYWLVVLLIGAVAGWLASAITDSSKGGLLLYIVLGILGAFVGTWLLGLLHIFASENIWGTLITSTVGAVFIILVVRLITGGKI